ncbi:MAG: T9SS type A sorting domain-containing protein [Bacteroidia bacterium]|nr:T9SS type A sorting domain-containing protein [Bacteroidia bacterium]
METSKFKSLLRFNFRISSFYILCLFLSINIAHAATITSKAAGGNWNAPSTWVGNTVPAINDQVIIDGTVNITSNIECKTVTINLGKILTFTTGGYNLTLNGTWITSINNSGTIVANDGTIIIKGNGQQITGTIAFNNVTIDGAQQTKFTSSQTINGTIILKNGGYINNTGNHPNYGTNAIMEIYGNYSISTNYYLWGNTAASTPANIIIASGNVNAQQNILIKKSLVVNNGATLNTPNCCYTLMYPTFETIDNNGTMNLGGVTIQTGVTWNVGSNITLSNFNIQDGATVNLGNQMVYINYQTYGNCNANGKFINTNNSGIFNAESSTIVVNLSYNGNGTVTQKVEFNNLVLTGGVITTNNAGTEIVVNGNLTVNSGTSFQYGNNIDDTKLSFGPNASITNNGGTTDNLEAIFSAPPVNYIDQTLTALPNSNSGGGIFSSGRYLAGGNKYSLTQDIVINNGRKVLIIYPSSEFYTNGYKITADSVYIYGKLIIANTSLDDLLGSTKIYIDNASTIEYKSASSQTIKPTTYGNLSLSGNGEKILLSGNYTIKGNLTKNGGNVQFNANSVFKFLENKQQNIAGLPFYSIELGGSNDKILTDTAKVNGRISITGSARLISNGLLTLVSTATHTASIGELIGSADVVGSVTSQRYVPAITRRYRMISPNTSNFTYNEIKDNIFVTGQGGAANGFDVSNPNSASIYSFQESLVGGRGWKAVTNINQTLNAGKGVIIYIRGDRSLPAPQWYTAPYVPQNEVTLDFKGTINKGNISPAITYSSTGSIEDDGFNLVGNPYPSAIDWSFITKQNLSAYFYVFNPSTNGYEAKNGSEKIASGQAFFVHAISANPSITFTESSKTSETPVSYFKTATNPLTVKMISDSLNSDFAKLEFKSTASYGFNVNEDALKFYNSAINVGFVIDGKETQINTIPALSSVADTFTLFVYAPNGNYRLAISNFMQIPDSKGIFLKDLALNTLTNLRTNPIYNFNTSTATGGSGNRFLLIITSQMGAVPVEFVSIQANPIEKTNDVSIHWITASEIDNEKFEIERSFNNSNFETIGKVQGAGTSKVTNSYLFVDSDAISKAKTKDSKIIYYRIRQTDYSSKNRLSNIVAVNIGNQINEINNSIYPNPAKNFTVIKSLNNKAIGKVMIYTVSGQKIIEKTVWTEQLNLDISTLQSGIYFIQIEGERQIQKLIVE